jgi:antitoxin component of RelBE/YafQ-DinJ toxin-antitoxin module
MSLSEADIDSFCLTDYIACMTMLSFRADTEVALQTQVWCDRLGIDRSDLLREALRLHLNRLASETEAEIWVSQPLDENELAFAKIANWGPAEDWSDWADAAR